MQQVYNISAPSPCTAPPAQPSLLPIDTGNRTAQVILSQRRVTGSHREFSQVTEIKSIDIWSAPICFGVCFGVWFCCLGFLLLAVLQIAFSVIRKQR